MSATDPNPSNNPSVTGQESWFNKDVRVFEDLYVYGNLYYDFEGTDSLNLDNLNVTGIATFKDIVITGQIDATDLNLEIYSHRVYRPSPKSFYQNSIIFKSVF